MPGNRRALIDQLRAHLTQQQFDSVVIHNYCRSAEHFLDYLARRQIAVDAAMPDHVLGISATRSGRKVTVKWTGDGSSCGCGLIFSSWVLERCSQRFRRR